MSEFSFLSEILTDIELTPNREYKIVVLLLMSDKYEALSSADIMGVDSLKLLSITASDYDCHMVKYSGEADYAQLALPYASGSDYVVMLHCDTPLVTSSTLHDAVYYATSKNLDFCILPRGAILSSSAIVQDKFELSARIEFLPKEDFIRVFDEVSLSQVREILRHRIIASHLQAGVNILSENNVYIDYNVTIGRGTTIYAFNSIRGNSNIGRDCTLLEHNIVVDSTIGDGCELVSSIVKNAVIDEKSQVIMEKRMNDKK